ncbi:MAG: hypothetical protein U0Z75_05390 [Deinococcaceae bacterium]
MVKTPSQMTVIFLMATWILPATLTSVEFSMAGDLKTILYLFLWLSVPFWLSFSFAMFSIKEKHKFVAFEFALGSGLPFVYGLNVFFGKANYEMALGLFPAVGIFLVCIGYTLANLWPSKKDH